MDVANTNSTFVVKYLGYRTTSHLWGIKYTRNPVDEMVKKAKLQLTSDNHEPLPLLKMEVTSTGIKVSPMPQNLNPSCPTGKFKIETISYGVQDIVYTRVFAMIVVKDDQIKISSDSHPFRCHAFVCDSRETARKLTMELAKSFEVYSKKVKGIEESDGEGEAGASGNATGGQSAAEASVKKQKFTIDLRSPEEIRRDEEGSAAEEQDFLDSEA